MTIQSCRRDPCPRAAPSTLDPRQCSLTVFTLKGSSRLLRIHLMFYLDPGGLPPRCARAYVLL